MQRPSHGHGQHSTERPDPRATLVLLHIRAEPPSGCMALSPNIWEVQMEWNRSKYPNENGELSASEPVCGQCCLLAPHLVMFCWTRNCISKFRICRETRGDHSASSSLWSLVNILFLPWSSHLPCLPGSFWRRFSYRCCRCKQLITNKPCFSPSLYLGIVLTCVYKDRLSVIAPWCSRVWV